VDNRAYAVDYDDWPGIHGVNMHDPKVSVRADIFSYQPWI